MGQWTVFHPGALFLTFLSYALYHMVRKTPSYVQSSLISEWTPAPTHLCLNHNTTSTTASERGSLFQNQQSAEAFMGILNAIFLFVYAAGNVISGVLADRLDLRLFLTLGMTLSAVVMFIFGPVLEWTGSYSQAAYIVLQILNALFQSTGWPCLVPIMASWFSKESRGYLLGLWSSSPSVGSIVGALILSEVVGYGYEYAFVVTSSLLFAGGVLIFFGLVTSPHEAGLTKPVDQYLLLSNDDSVDDDVDDEGRSSTLSSDGERRMLLERKKDLQKRCLSHAPVSNRDRNDSYCSTKFTANDSTPKGVASFATYQDERTKLSPSSALPSHAQQISAQTASALHAVGVGTYATHADVRPENSLRSHEKNRSDTNHQHGSDSTITAYHDITSRPMFHKDTNSVSHDMSEELPTHSLENADPDQTFHDALRSKAERCSQAEAENQSLTNNKPKAIGICQAILLPGVIPFSLCFAFLKLVLYVFFFWLPFYLASSYGWSESTADRLALWYDVGGIARGVVSAFLMSKLNKSALIMAPMMVISIPVMYMYGILRLGSDLAVNAAMLFCLGSLLAGLGNLLSAAVSEDLSHQQALQGSTRAMATVTGILEGCGTVGAALGQIVVPYLNSAFGWDSLFYFLMACTFLSALSVSPIMVSEVKEVLRNRRKL